MQRVYPLRPPESCRALRRNHYFLLAVNRLPCYFLLLQKRSAIDSSAHLVATEAGFAMKSGRLALAVSIALLSALPSPCQQQTIAKLRPESRGDIASADIPRGTPVAQSSGLLRDSATSRAAADALFARSDLQRARVLTDKALFRDIGDAEALFVRMELAALEGEDTTALFTAVSLCEIGAYARGDGRMRLAAARVRGAAANTPDFRRAIPRLQLLLANTQQPW